MATMARSVGDHLERPAPATEDKDADVVRWAFAFILWSLLTFAVPVLSEAANLVRVQGFPFGFYLLAQGTPLAFALLGLWVSVWTLPHNGRPATALSRIEGVALAGLVLTPALTVFATARLEADGFDGLIFGHATMAGVVMWLLIRARPWGRQSSQTDHHLAAPHGSGQPAPARPGQWAVMLFAIALLPLATLNLHTASDLLRAIANGSIGTIEAVIGIAGIAVAMALVLPRRWLFALLALGTALTFAILLMLAFGLQAITQPSSPVWLLPQFAYGQTIADITRLEQDLTVAGLADPVTTRQFARPWTDLSMVNALGYIATLVLAVPALLTVATWTLPSENTAGVSRQAVRTAYAARGAQWMLLFCLALIITAPAVAAHLKAARYMSVEQGLSREALPDWLVRAADKHWVEVCRPPATALAPQTTAPSSEASDEIPDWWLDAEADDTAPSGGAPQTRSTASGPTANDALIAQYLDANNVCRGPLPRMAAGDFQPAPQAILSMAAAQAAAPRYAQLALQGLFLGVLIIGLAALFAISAPRSQRLEGYARVDAVPDRVSNVGHLVLAITGLAVASVALTITLPAMWTQPFELPVWTLALLAVVAAPLAWSASTPAAPGHNRIPGAIAACISVVAFVSTGAYLLATSEFTTTVSPWVPMLSNAPAWKFDDLEGLTSACLHGSTDACTAAKALSRQTANIMGLRPEAIGGLLGLSALVIVGLLIQATRQQKSRGQSFR